MKIVLEAFGKMRSAPNENQSISLQTHEHRDEFWRIIKGSGIIRIGDFDENDIARLEDRYGRV